jgi:hypothetical protein
MWPGVPLRGRMPHSDKRTSQAPVFKRTETAEQKYCAEHINELILVGGTEAHVTRSKFSRNETARLERQKETFVGAI